MNLWMRVVSEPVGVVQANLSLRGAACVLPIIFLCGLCVVATVIWGSAVSRYIKSQARHS
jgi:hypothetical protein